MNYTEVLNMRKEAAGGTLAKLFPRVAQRLARASAGAGRSRLTFGKTKLTSRLLSALAKDLPGAAAKGVTGGLKNGIAKPTAFLWKNVIPAPKLLAAGGALYGLSQLFPDKATSVADWGKSKAKEAYDYMNDTNKGIGTRVIAGPDGSVVSLFNPASGLTGGKDYVPAKWIDLVQKFIPGEAGKTTAHLTAKGGAMALLAAGLVGSYRLGKHLKDLGDIDKSDRPGKGMAGQLSTTFEGDLSGEGDEQKKAASTQSNPYDIYSPGNFTAQNLTATAIPIGTLLLAAGLTYKGVDSVFDKIRNKRLDKAIDQKEQAVKKLITARAQLAKGSQSMEGAEAATAPLKDSAIYTKEAAQEKVALIPETVQLFGTLSAAVLLASAIGAYSYAGAADENNIKYKAYKKALKEYAKAKSGMSPITMAPTNAANYFAAIDAAKEDKPATPRQQPSYDADALNKPISVSF